MHFTDFTHVVTLPMHQTGLSIPSVDGDNDAQSTEDNYTKTKSLTLGLAHLFTQPSIKHWEKGGTQGGAGQAILKEKEQPVSAGYLQLAYGVIRAGTT